jgi:hypothetical protein
MFEVFIGSSSESRKYAEIIETAINQNPMFSACPWWTCFRGGRSTFEQIINLLYNIDFAIFLTTPDDVLESRHESFPVARANVLLEYGLFSGNLGTEYALRLHIGPTRSPSDLYGVVDVFAKIDYKPDSSVTDEEKKTLFNATNEALEHFLRPMAGSARLDLQFLRTPDIFLSSRYRENIIGMLQAQQESHLSKVKERIRSYDHVPDLIKDFTARKTHEVGLKSSRTRTNAYVDFLAVREDPGAHHLLAGAFSHFIAVTVLELFADDLPTRFAVHDAHDQLPFLSKTLTELCAKPAITSVSSESRRGQVKGRFFGSERAVLLQAVTSTGNIPCHCALELASRGVNSILLLSFIAKQQYLRKIEQYCANHNMRFRPMTIQNADGAISIA